jgi:hypothetical protein
MSMPALTSDSPVLDEIVERLRGRYLTAGQLMRLLGARYNLQGWSPSAIQRKRACGEIDAICSGGRWTYTGDSIANYLLTHQED